MKTNYLILKLIAPSILCFLGLIFIYDKIDYYPLLFGLTIGVFNWNVHKHKLIIGIPLSLILSYITFYLAYFSIGLIGTTVKSLCKALNCNLNNEMFTIIAFIFSPHVIAPLLVFFAYKFVFRIPKTKTTLLVVMISIILLVIQAIAFLSTEIKDFKIFNPYVIWQIIMALGIQLLIYQEVITNKSKS